MAISKIDHKTDLDILPELPILARIRFALRISH
jgi:hypothetical protein